MSTLPPGIQAHAASPSSDPAVTHYERSPGRNSRPRSRTGTRAGIPNRAGRGLPPIVPPQAQVIEDTPEARAEAKANAIADAVSGKLNPIRVKKTRRQLRNGGPEAMIISDNLSHQLAIMNKRLKGKEMRPWTRTELGKRCGWTIKEISFLMTGKIPTIDQFRKLAQVFGVDPAHLLVNVPHAHYYWPALYPHPYAKSGKRTSSVRSFGECWESDQKLAMLLGGADIDTIAWARKHLRSIVRVARDRRQKWNEIHGRQRRGWILITEAEAEAQSQKLANKKPDSD